MPAIGALIAFTPLTTISSSDVAANFATIRDTVNTYGVFRDVATTITAAHTYSGLQTFTGGVTLSGATPNLVVGGTSTLTGAVTMGSTLAVTGVVTATAAINANGGVVGALTGNASTATALQTGRTIGMSGDITATGVTFDGTGNITLTGAITAGAIVNADVNAAAAIAYSKLALTGSIVDADVNAAAAIAYSKLALTGGIVNADINASAAIAASKLATITVAKGGTNLTATPTNGQLLIGNGTGYTLATLTAGANVTITNGAGTIEIASTGGGGGVSDGDKGDIVVSGGGTIWSIDTGVIVNADVNAAAAIAYSKLALSDSILNADINSAAAISYSKLNLAGGIVNADISGSAAIADTKLAQITTTGKVANSATTATSANTASAIVARDGSGAIAVGAITGTTIDATTQFNVNGTKVVGARNTGWAGIAGTTDLKDASVYDFSEIAAPSDWATAQSAVGGMARQLRAVVNALIGHGLFGS